MSSHEHVHSVKFALYDNVNNYCIVLYILYNCILNQAGGKDVLKRSWKDLANHITVKVRIYSTFKLLKKVYNDISSLLQDQYIMFQSSPVLIHESVVTDFLFLNM